MSDQSNLLKSQGWADLLKFMEQQVRIREQNVIHMPCANMEAVFEQEYEKGEISGIFQVLNMPGEMIKRLEGDIKTREAELPLEENDE